MLNAPSDFVCDDANAGRRVDTVLRRVRPMVPLGTLMKWLRKGHVRLNGRRCAPATRLAVGDVLRMPHAPTAPAAAQDAAVRRRPRLPALAIVYEDADLLVIDKPAHLACHPGTKQGPDSLAARIVQHLGAEAAPVGHRPGLAQRLDAGVSGLLPVGKHAASLRNLAQQGMVHTLEKTYVALVWGHVTPASGAICMPLHVGDEPRGDRPRVVFSPDGQTAVTLFRVVQRFADSTLLAVRLRTGRTHQIRAHLLALGHPLWGDPRYGDAPRNAELHGRLGLSRPFLHASHLSLMHPAHGTLSSFEAVWPTDLRRVLAAARPACSPETLWAALPAKLAPPW
jgi:RluA family pseudouridine synthase